MKKSKKDSFLELVKPDEDRFSRKVSIKELDTVGIEFGNGGD